MIGYESQTSPQASNRLGSPSGPGAWLKQEDSEPPENTQQNRYEPIEFTNATSSQFGSTFVDYLKNRCDLASDSLAVIGKLQVAVERTNIEPQNSSDLLDQPIRAFVELTIEVCKGFDRQSGERAQRLFDEVGILIDEAVQPEAAFEKACYDAMHRLSALIREYNRKSKIFEKRLIETERGRSRSKNAHALIRNEILGAISDKTLPKVFFDFIHEVWEKYLYVTYLRDGLGSPVWTEAVEDFKTMIWCLTVDDPEALFLSYGKIAETFERMRVSSRSICVRSARGTIRALWEVVESIITCAIQRTSYRIPDLVKAPLFHGEEGTNMGSPNISSSKCSMVESLGIGDWFLQRKSGSNVRHKLVEKDSTHGYLLFSNLSGIRSLRLSILEADDALCTGSLKRIDTSHIFEKALEFSCRRVSTTLPNDESQKRLDERDKTRLPELDIELDLDCIEILEGTSLKAEGCDSPDNIAQLPIATGESSDVDSEPIKYEVSRELEQLAHKRDLDSILLDVQSMRPGGWVHLISGNDEPVACRLGLKSIETGNLIFVDSGGKKVDELNPEKLAASIAAGSAVILDFGPHLDDGS